MIFTRQRHYSFKQPFLQVHYIHPAFNNSIVLIALQRIGQDALYHIDKDGNVAFFIDFFDFDDTLCILNEKEVIILRVERNQIWSINLEKKQIIKFRHQFEYGVSCQCYLDYFCDSKLLCIMEKGDFGTQAINLTYYSTPLSPSKPFQIEYDQDNLKYNNIQQIFPLTPYASLKNCQKWDPTMTVRKVNAQSKYVWHGQRYKDQLVIFQAEVVNASVEVKTLRISLKSLCTPYRLHQLQISIVQIWQIRPQELIFYSQTNKNEKRCINLKQGVVNNTFVWDLQKNTIRQCNFAFDKNYHDNQIDIVGTPTFSMFRTFCFCMQQVLESPAYYVNNNNEKIIQSEAWKCTHLQKYYVPDYLKDTIVEAAFENDIVKQMNVRIIKKVFPSELSLFLLLNMEKKPGEKGTYEDWDFDLLYDVINALDMNQ